jgi:hypothetical protein
MLSASNVASRWRSSTLALHGASLTGLLRVGIPRNVVGRGFRTAVNKGRCVVSRCNKKLRMHSTNNKPPTTAGKEAASEASSAEKAGRSSAGGCAGASGAGAAGAEPEVAEKMTLKLMWERYGTVAIGTHFGVYFATLAALYVAVSET